MDRIFRIRNSVMDYLSPRANRRRTMGPSTPSNKATSLMRTLPEALSEPRNRKGQAVVAGRVSKKYLSPSDTKRSHQARRRNVIREDAYEAETEDGYRDSLDNASESSIGVSPADSSSQQPIGDLESEIMENFQEEGQGEEDEELNLNGNDESELSSEAKVKFFLDRQNEIAKRQEELDRIKKEDWHEDEAALFHKLTMRGYEPLLPSNWAYDFRTCPSQLFTQNMNQTFLNSASGNDFRAINALSSLITLGGRVRSLIECHKPQEQLIKKELDNYVKWSERDGNYNTKRFLPRLSIVAGHPDQEIPNITRAITDQLRFLAIRHRQALALPHPGRLNELGEVEVFMRPPPVLYGVIIAHCITLFVTLDSSKVDAQIRTIAHFDFSNADMDVWNSFAVAILVCMVRNKIMENMDLLESESESPDTDPDS
ncbi:MAG: hypothetical protein M1818_004245 [Claussenomyces sp. TS43310]|nr:MAG: hypothetical protein M1818_004245 [Claussenomyces sp. TS43310]